MQKPNNKTSKCISVVLRNEKAIKIYGLLTKSTKSLYIERAMENYLRTLAENESVFSALVGYDIATAEQLLGFSISNKTSSAAMPQSIIEASNSTSTAQATPVPAQTSDGQQMQQNVNTAGSHLQESEHSINGSEGGSADKMCF